MKLCTQCKLRKNFPEFSPKGNGKFASRCKVCLANNRRNAYKKQDKAIEGSSKQCIVCFESKPIDKFYSN